MVKSVFNGTETVSCRVQNTLGIVPDDIKESLFIEQI